MVAARHSCLTVKPVDYQCSSSIAKKLLGELSCVCSILKSGKRLPVLNEQY